MVVDIIASLSFAYVIYKMARESSRNERFGGTISAGIGAIYCASQLTVWPNGCTEPFTGTLKSLWAIRRSSSSNHNTSHYHDKRLARRNHRRHYKI